MLRESPPPYQYGIHVLNISYPVYSVVTPQTGLQFSVRGLTVSEVSKVRGSIVTPAAAIKLIHNIIWDAIVEKPDFIRTKQDFLRMITLKDREALLHGIYLKTFNEPEPRDFRVRCKSCFLEKDIKLDLSRCIEIQPYPGTEAMKNQYILAKSLEGDAVKDEEMEKIIQEDMSKKVQTKVSRSDVINIIESPNAETQNVEGSQPPEDVPLLVPKDKKIENVVDVNFELPEILKNSILTKEIKVLLPISQVYAIVCQPVLKDEEDLSELLPFAQKKDLVDVANETIIIKRFEYTTTTPFGTKEVLSITDKMQIFSEYQKLPYSDRNIILNTYRENFGNYGITLKDQWICPNCASENEIFIDILSQFFRMASTG